MTQFLRDQAIDSEEVVTPLMLDGTYLSRNFATLGPMIRQPPCDLKTASLIFFFILKSPLLYRNLLVLASLIFQKLSAKIEINNLWMIKKEKNEKHVIREDD